jgi:hypothetical protein
LNDPETRASTLLVLMTDLFGMAEFVNWEPETIHLELADLLTVGWSRLPKLVRDRIDAVTAAVSTNNVYVSLESFIHVVNAFAGGGVDFSTFDPATIEESALAVLELNLLDDDGGRDNREKFSGEIRKYLGVRAEYEGLTRQPSILKWADAPKKSEPDAVDADMFAASWREEQDSLDQINGKVQARRIEILRQIDSLPLGRRDRESWDAFFGKAAKA